MFHPDCRSTDPFVQWLASRQLDEALSVFVALHQAADVVGLEPDFRNALLEIADRILDDVTQLASLAGHLMWPSPVDAEPFDGFDVVIGACRRLMRYATALEMAASVFRNRDGLAERAFHGLANSAAGHLDRLHV
jgi:hypothetical protein